MFSLQQCWPEGVETSCPGSENAQEHCWYLPALSPGPADAWVFHWLHSTPPSCCSPWLLPFYHVLQNMLTQIPKASAILAFVFVINKFTWNHPYKILVMISFTNIKVNKHHRCIMSLMHIFSLHKSYYNFCPAKVLASFAGETYETLAWRLSTNLCHLLSGVPQETEAKGA